LRVLRIIRLFRFLTELRLLVHSILGALRAMIWAALLIVLALYVSAVLTTNLWGRQHLSGEAAADISLWFGTLGSSFFTLFQLTTLEDWPEVVRGVMSEVPLAWIFFVPFLMLMNFAMLNAITAVVVEKVFTVARSEAAAEARHQERKRADMLRKIRNIFEEIDTDGSGDLELEEFQQALTSPAVVQSLMELGIAKCEAGDLFACLDLDGDCKVSTTEFVAGCLRAHGPAQSNHLLQVQFDILRNCAGFKADLEELSWHVRWVVRHLARRQTGRGSGRRHEPSARPSLEAAGKQADRAPASHGGPALPGPSAGSTCALRPRSGTADPCHTAAGTSAGASSSDAAGGAAGSAGCSGAPTSWSAEPLSEAEAQEAVDTLREIRSEQQTLRGAVERLIEEVRCIHEELPLDPNAEASGEGG